MKCLYCGLVFADNLSYCPWCKFENKNHKAKVKVK